MFIVRPVSMRDKFSTVGNGVVASLAQPGGNVTVSSTQTSDTAGKRLELLREVVCSGLREATR
jgi:putative tryptophan/tyrosine transport system substrate-binding protein